MKHDVESSYDGVSDWRFCYTADTKARAEKARRRLKEVFTTPVYRVVSHKPTSDVINKEL